MPRLILTLTIISLLFSCSRTELPQRDYYGALRIEDHTFRLLFNNKNKKPSLLIVGFRGNEIPIQDVSFKNDTLRFSRANMFSTYKGHYDANTGNISGLWTGEDRIAHPLTFVPVITDTIVGLNPRTTNAYQHTQPPDENDGIDVCSLQSANMNAGIMDSLVRAIMKKKFAYVHSMLIARNNCLALEEYFYGYKREAHFGIQSATKSMVSALTGIALANGEIADVNTPLCNYLPEYRDLLCNPQNKSITLHDVLNMSTGLKWDEVTHMYGNERNSLVIAGNQPDQFRYLLSQPRSKEKQFAYNSLNHTMMSHVLMERTKLDNPSEFKQRLLDPLGITHYDLGEPDKGIIGDIFLRPRDMLKFGLLYYNNGVWKGKQLVPSAWVKESTSPKIMLEPGLGYGYFWWTKQFSWKGKTVDSYFAWGFGGQYIFVVPKLDLVVIFNGTNWSTDPKEFYFDIMQEYIIRACEK
jgi:CubicO group peptidase (beta-lactamase class C family)